MTATVVTRRLAVRPVSAQAFARFGEFVEAQPDGAVDAAREARLDLSQGTPRFYIMRLAAKPLRFSRITRHRRVTQCLGSLGGHDWLMAVAPPEGVAEPDARPDPDQIAAFRIPGSGFIKLHAGTWHAGPYFARAELDFYNLELADTNVTDHHTVDLAREFGIEFAFAAD